MGFMASGAGAFAEAFGKSFSSSYEKSADREARTEEKEADRKFDSQKMIDDRKHDIFLAEMKITAESKTKYDEAKEKDRKLVSAAEGISTDTGAPKEWSLARLKDGYTPAQVRTMGGQYDWRQGSAQTASSVAPAAPTTDTQASGQSAPTQSGLDQDKAGATQEQMDMAFPSESGGEDVPDESVDNPVDADLTEGLPPSTRPEAAANGGPEIRVGDVVGVPRVKPGAKSSVYDNYQAALQSGDEAEISRTKALVDEYSQTINANRPGKTVVDLQNDLVVAKRNKDEAAAQEIQATIDATTSSEVSSKQIAEGPQQGVWVDNDGNYKSGVVKPIRDPETGNVTWQSEDGVGGRPMVKGEPEALKDFFTIAGTEGKEQRQKAVDMAASYRSAARINDILTENPDILAGGTGAVTGFISDMAGEVRAAGKLLNVEVNENSEGGYTPDTIKALEDKIQGLNIKDIEDDAAKRAIFNAEMAIMSYRAGAAMGQTGASLGKNDLGFIRSIVGADASKGVTAQEIMINYLDNARRQVNDSSVRINSEAEAKMKGQFGWAPMEKVAPTVEDIVNQNPDDENLHRGFNLKAPQITRPTNENTPAQPSSKEEFDKLPSGTVFIDPQGNKRRKP